MTPAGRIAAAAGAAAALALAVSAIGEHLERRAALETIEARVEPLRTAIIHFWARHRRLPGPGEIVPAGRDLRLEPGGMVRFEPAASGRGAGPGVLRFVPVIDADGLGWLCRIEPGADHRLVAAAPATCRDGGRWTGVMHGRPPWLIERARTAVACLAAAIAAAALWAAIRACRIALRRSRRRAARRRGPAR